MDEQMIARDRADWLLDAIAGATQNRSFLRGDPEYNEVVGEAILLNGEKAITTALTAAIAGKVAELTAQNATLRRKLKELGCEEISNVDEHIAALAPYPERRHE